ncbi:hypothetical protein ACLKA6_014771, partial [Drosophila palustris]
KITRLFLELKSLGTFKVKVEKIYRRRKLVLQCYKCQRFGHTLRDCTATEPTCVKCAGQHTSRICSITDQADRSCSNCKGKHPASWDRCPIYLAALQAKGLSKKSSRAKSAIQAIGLQTSQSFQGSLTQRLLFSNTPPAAHDQPPAAHDQPPAAQDPPPEAQDQIPADQDQPPAAQDQPPVDHGEPLAAYDSDNEEDFDEEDTDDFCDLVPLIFKAAK